MSKLFLILVFLCSSVQAEVAPMDLVQAVSQKMSHVREFKFIQDVAAELGVRVYLFGGTASSFAHYVRQDLERAQGSQEYQGARFDYDYANIYRSNQDLDIVIDGTPEQAEILKKILMETFDHFIGERQAWEIRLLDQQTGDKLPLRGDSDFLNQDTDSNSTGLIELTAAPGEQSFRDLRGDWDVEESQFLQDVAAGEITYYFSDAHFETQRFLQGKNPPILGAVRYLAKRTQFVLNGKDSDLERVRQVVQETDFSQIKGYVKTKLKEFGLKALLNSPDVEYAWDLLDQVGLREKLIEIDSENVDKVGTVAWWFSKEPLRSKKIGQGSGKTAEELEIKIVAHETNDFAAYENLTRSTQGVANVFISRQNIKGELAAYGEGFYTKKGKEGAKNTGLTVRYTVDPRAKEGEDFVYDPKTQYVIILNKDVIKLIPENLDISFVDFFSLMLKGTITKKDKGLIIKLTNKFERMKDFISQNDFEAVYYLLSLSEWTDETHLIFETWFSFEKSADYPKVLSKFLTLERVQSKKIDLQLVKRIVQSVFSHEHWYKHIEKLPMTLMLDEKIMEVIVKDIMSKPHFKSFALSWISSLIEFKFSRKELIAYVFSQEHFTDQEKLIEKLMEDPQLHKYIARYILSQEHWSHKRDWVYRILGEGHATYEIIHFVYSQEFEERDQAARRTLIRENPNRLRRGDDRDLESAVGADAFSFYNMLNLIQSGKPFAANSSAWQGSGSLSSLLNTPAPSSPSTNNNNIYMKTTNFYKKIEEKTPLIFEENIKEEKNHGKIEKLMKTYMDDSLNLQLKDKIKTFKPLDAFQCRQLLK